MKLATEVSADKLRGGFYTPQPLVAVCLDRVLELLASIETIDLLEPSIGDGAFLKGLAVHPLRSRVRRVVGLDIAADEATKAREVAERATYESDILVANALEWCANTKEEFDAAVGNPPFVRFQFIEDTSLGSASALGDRIGVIFRGVSNLWIPLFLGALSRVAEGGAFAFVVPSELFTGVSAGAARQWLLQHCERITIDLFEPGTFPNVLQQVVVVSGQRETRSSMLADSRPVRFVEHMSQGVFTSWSHSIAVNDSSWTRYLLTPEQIEALEFTCSLQEFHRFRVVAKMEVSIVTGANDYFSVSREEAQAHHLEPWLEPLLPRIRYAQGLVYSHTDHTMIADSSTKAWLLNFSDGRPDPRANNTSEGYIVQGEQQGINRRYKTRIRDPWYRVPSIWSGRLLLSKRSHLFPRLVFNECGVLTTDTIYRGNMLPAFQGREKDLVSLFHNSITLLTVELEGRSFGGGVLELVPSEIARLLVPMVRGASATLPKLDRLARDNARNGADPETLIEATDRLMLQAIPQLPPEIAELLRDARQSLLRRRLDRN